MSDELRKIIKKIEQESYPKYATIYDTNDQYDDELDTDRLWLSSHS